MQGIGSSLGGMLLSEREASSRERRSNYGYSPAAYFVSGITIFSLAGKRSFIQIPLDLASPKFSPDGSTIYSQAARLTGQPGIYEIKLEPARARLLKGTDLLREGFLGISFDGKTLFICTSFLTEPKENFRIFRLDLTDPDLDVGRHTGSEFDFPLPIGEFAPIVEFSPDGASLLTRTRGVLRVIDIGAKTSKVLGEGFSSAAWSPNGTWILTTDQDLSTCTIVDANSLIKLRSFPGFKGVWSPDSRYILHWAPWKWCFSLFQTLGTFEVETGRLSTVEGSRCKVLGGTLGWVKAGITGTPL